jgi:hypothetical protein
MTPQPEATIAKPTPNSHGNPKTKLKNLPRPRLDVRECVYVHSTYRTTGTDTRSDTRGHAALSVPRPPHGLRVHFGPPKTLPDYVAFVSENMNFLYVINVHERGPPASAARPADRSPLGVLRWSSRGSFASTTFNDCYSSTKPPLLWRTASATSRSHSGALALYLGPSWH